MQIFNKSVAKGHQFYTTHSAPHLYIVELTVFQSV